MKRFLLSIGFVFAFIFFGYGQNAGFFGSPLSFVQYNDTSIEADDFNGSNLGYITSLTLNGSEIRTFKNGVADVTGAFINYRVYEAGSTPGSFTEESIAFGSDLGGGDQLWLTSGLGIDLISGLSGGNYKFEVFFRISTTGCCEGQVFQSNLGSNYTADFSIPYRTESDGNWSATSTWVGGIIPPSGATVFVDHNITLNTDATVSSLTINNGATFTATDGTNRTLTISKSIAGNQTTFENNGTWSNGASNSTIVFTGEPNSGDAIHQIRGTSATEFFNITVNKTGGTNNVGADFENSTVSGTLEIGTGGFISTAPPSGFYTEDAILLFNQGASANFVVNAGGFTWSTSEIPNNITVQSGTVTLADNRNVSSEILINSDAALAINSGNTLSSTGVITNNGTINIDGDLVFTSTADGTAQYGNSSGTVTGNVTVERFIPKRSDENRAFRFLASSVGDVSIANSWQTNTHITGHGGSTNGFDDSGSNNPSMFIYAEAEWDSITNTADNLLVGRGYRTFIRGDRTVSLTDNSDPATDVTLSAKGTFQTGSFSAPDMASIAEKFSFVGNPYQAIVDLGLLTYGNGVINDYVYYWDPSLADRGAFVGIDISTNTNEVDPEVPTPGTSEANKFLQPGQAVFFRNSDDAALTDYSITFEEADKATSEPALSVFSTDDNTTSTLYINLRLYETAKFNNGAKEQDAVGFRFYADGNNAVDNNDARKLGNLSENLAIEHSTDLLAIEKRALPTLEEELQLFISNYQHQDYTFRIDVQNFDETTQPLLVDAYTNETYALSNDVTTIQFTIDEAASESLNNQRFSIQFEDTTLSQTEFSKNNFSIYPNPVQDVLHINWKEIPSGDTKISIFNLVGKRIASFQQDASDEVQTISVQSLEAGVYLLKIQNEDVNVTKKFIKR